MITGVETAGLALAALPLVIIALEQYNKGLKPLKDFVKYKSKIEELSCSLKLQNISLRHTCERLLTGVVDSEYHVASLLQDPTSDAWREEQLTLQLQERLQDAYSIYNQLVRRIYDALNILKDKMGLDTEGNPRWVDEKSRKRHFKRFATCLSLKEHEALLAQISSANSDLRDLTSDSLQLEPVRSHRKKHTKSFKEVRNHAARLYNALQDGLSCDCSARHYAHLRLEQRAWQDLPSFRLTFPTAGTVSEGSRWTFHETDIKVLTKRGATAVTSDQRKPAHSLSDHQTASPSGVFRKILPSSSSARRKRISFAIVPGIQLASMQFEESVSYTRTTTPSPGGSSDQVSVEEPKVIGNLCDTLRCRLPGECTAKYCIGRFVDEHSHYDIIGLPNRQQNMEGAVNLHELLNRACSTSDDSIGTRRLTRKARLKLAVILASTALQLHTTPWLGNDWTGKRILFRDESLDYPFISTAFPSEALNPGASRQCGPGGPIRNQAIFSLGVLLLELAVGRPLDFFRNVEQPAPFEDYLIASQLVAKLSDEEGEGYANAAQACIYCNFRIKAKDLDLDNDAFRKAVYEDVICPLEQDFNYFCQTSRQT